MSYYFKNDDFGCLEIPNIFIEKYMKQANGTYVKVYLYALKKAKERLDNYSDRDLAMDLEISIEDVQMAWNYWERVSLIKKEANNGKPSILFIDPRNYLAGGDIIEEPKPEMESIVVPQGTTEEVVEVKQEEEEDDERLEPDVEILLQAVKMPEISNMFTEIDSILKRESSPFEKQKILSWITDYNMNPDVIEEAFIYASRDGKKANVNYVGGIIRNWYSAGITTITDVKNFFEENDVRMLEYKQVMQALGSSSNISEHGRLMVDRWRDEYGFSMELILKAFENTTKIQNPNLNYIDKIITDWHQKGVKAIVDIPDAPKRASEPVVRNKFHDFKQREDQMSDKEIEEMMEKRRKKILEEDSDI